MKLGKNQIKALLASKGRFEIRAADDTDTAHVYLYSEIGYFGVDADQMVREINAITSENITLHINCPGGDVFDGTAIYNALKRHKAKVTSIIEGCAASMATIIALAGEKILIEDNAYVMIHNPSTLAWGDADEMRAVAAILDKIEDQMVKIYAKAMGKSEDDVRAIMDAETWWNADEAVENGYAAKVEGEPADKQLEAALTTKITASSPDEQSAMEQIRAQHRVRIEQLKDGLVTG